MLWHARLLSDLGHSVTVLGATRENEQEEDITFLHSPSNNGQTIEIDQLGGHPPDVILLEGAYSAASVFRKQYPKAAIVHVGQNIDRLGAKGAFSQANCIDLYGLVSPGHFAEYSWRYPHLRDKFVLIRNAVPWSGWYANLQVQPPSVSKKITWVGAWSKEGLRRWAETMALILKDFPDYEWHLFGPNHGGVATQRLSPKALAGVPIPLSKTFYHSLGYYSLSTALSSCRMVLVSLGNETACISALDAHAAGRPVISGNDSVFQHVNPRGTGMRVATAEQRYRAVRYLIENPTQADSMGRLGRLLVEERFSEKQQREDLMFVMELSKNLHSSTPTPSFAPPSRLASRVSSFKERIQNRLANVKTSVL